MLSKALGDWAQFDEPDQTAVSADADDLYAEELRPW